MSNLVRNAEVRVLHLVAGNLAGGAARGAYWLHQGLQGLDVHSHILTTARNNLGDKSVTSVTASRSERLRSMLRIELDNAPTRLYPRRERKKFSTGWIGYDFTRRREYREANIIHLHWVNQGMVDVRHLRKVDKPLVWTLRDQWPMTGGCHYADQWGCGGFRGGCGNCRQLHSSTRYDLSRWMVRRKRGAIPATTRVVGISEWLSQLARESTVFRGFDVRTIPNNIDTETFAPIPRGAACDILGLDQDRNIVLACAQSLSQPYKGFADLLQALPKLERSRVQLCFFGDFDPSLVAGLGFDHRCFGYLHDALALRLLYSAADVFVAPSHFEAFGKTLAEAMACATPVVCYDATGPREIVKHQRSGYRARAYDPAELAAGINWVLEHDPATLGASARARVVEHFDIRVIARRYLALYEELLGGQSPPESLSD